MSILKNEFFITLTLTIYQQTFGIPMDSLLSLIIADIILQNIEERTIKSIKEIHLLLYRRCMNGKILTAPKTFTNHIKNIFNSYHKRLQFTIENSENNRINLLNILIIVEDCKIYCNYKKSTFSGRYFNFLSHHPIQQKRGTFLCIVDRAILSSYPIS